MKELLPGRAHAFRARHLDPLQCGNDLWFMLLFYHLTPPISRNDKTVAQPYLLILTAQKIGWVELALLFVPTRNLRSKANLTGNAAHLYSFTRHIHRHKAASRVRQLLADG